MKKLIVAVIALTSFKVLSFAQAVPTKQEVAPKMHVVKSTTSKNKGEKTIVTTNVALARTKTVVVTKPTTIIKTNTTTALKKDGTPDKRYKSHSLNVAGPLKKDGTPDLRYKVNKKH